MFLDVVREAYKSVLCIFMCICSLKNISQFFENVKAFSLYFEISLSLIVKSTQNI